MSGVAAKRIHPSTARNPTHGTLPSYSKALRFFAWIATFDKPEIVRINCDLHSWMRGWIVVAEHPFYAVTNEEGEFVFENVPPGKYKLQAWQETLGRANQEVTVTGEGTQTLTVRMEKK